MSSARLPGKVMKDISGHPMLFHLVERCRRSRRADMVLVATSVGRDDDVIAGFCKTENIECYRGALNNVLERYYEVAKEAGARGIVRITADCPLIDPRIIDQCVEAFEKSEIDYISNVNPKRTFPRGLDVEVFSFRALEKAHHEALTPFEREHVTPYLWENKKGEFILGSPVIAPPSHQSDVCLAVDYPEDLDMIKEVYMELYREGEIVNVREAIRFLTEHKEIANLNRVRGRQSF